MANLKSLAKDTAIYGMSSILGRFLNYLLVPLYTAKLSAASGGYGIITNVYAYTALLLVILTYGADLLVKGGVRIAETLGIPSVIIGLTLVSFATSAPELVVSVQAALKGSGDISLGNVVGSNIFNILAILGIAPLVRPIQAVGIHTVDLAAMAGVTILMLGMAYTGKSIRRWEGGVLLLCYAAYLVWLVFHAGA